MIASPFLRNLNYYLSSYAMICKVKILSRRSIIVGLFPRRSMIVRIFPRKMHCDLESYIIS